MTPPVSFGVFDLLDRRDIALAQLYEERLQLVEAADAAGFFCYHLGEHHGTPLGMAPSPSLFLSAAAQRTRRIRLGPLVYLLPLYSPLRLIEEICMLDHLSGGRLELGVGRGVSPYEVAYHGLDASRTRALFEEALAVILAGLTGDRLTHHGAHYRYEDVPMELRPLQQPYPPLWYASSSLASVDMAAARGMNFMGVSPTPVYRAFVERYREVRARHANDTGRLNPHVAEPRIGIQRMVLVADTDAEAEAIARKAHPRWSQSFAKLWLEHGSQPPRAADLESALRQETLLCGSARRVRAQVARLLEGSGANYVTCSFAWGDLGLAESMHSLRLFAQEVMPEFSSAVRRD